MTTEERNAAGICLTVTDAQARALVRLRDEMEMPDARFASQIRPDGTRAVVNTPHVMVANLDAGGYLVEARDGRWHRTLQQGSGT